MARNTTTRVKFPNLTQAQKAVRELLALQKELKGPDWYHQSCKSFGIPTTDAEQNGLPADHAQSLDEYEAMFNAYGDLLLDIFTASDGYLPEDITLVKALIADEQELMAVFDQSPQPECEEILAKHTNPKRRSFSMEKAAAIRQGWHPDATQAEKDEAVATVLHEFGPAKHLSRKDASWLLEVIFTA